MPSMSRPHFNDVIAPLCLPDPGGATCLRVPVIKISATPFERLRLCRRQSDL